MSIAHSVTWKQVVEFVKNCLPKGSVVQKWLYSTLCLRWCHYGWYKYIYIYIYHIYLFQCSSNVLRPGLVNLVLATRVSHPGASLSSIDLILRGNDICRSSQSKPLVRVSDGTRDGSQEIGMELNYLTIWMSTTAMAITRLFNSLR